MHFFTNIISDSSSDKSNTINRFIMDSQAEGRNHLAYPTYIQAPSDSFTRSVENIPKTVELIMNHHIDQLYVFPYYIGLNVYCYLYKEGISRTKFFTNDGLLLEFYIEDERILNLYTSLLDSISEIYKKIDWSVMTRVIIKGVITPYFNVSNLFPFNNVYNDIFPYENWGDDDTVSYVDFFKLCICTKKQYLKSDHFVRSAKIKSEKIDKGVKLNISERFAYKQFEALMNESYSKDIRFKSLDTIFQLGKNHNYIHKLVSDFTGLNKEEITFKPLHVVKYDYVSNNHEKTKLVIINLKNVVVSHLYGEHEVLSINNSFHNSVSANILKDKLQDLLYTYSHVNYSQGIFIVPVNCNNFIEGIILRNKHLLSILSNKFYTSFNNKINSDVKYDQMLKFIKSLTERNLQMLNTDEDSITMFNYELPSLVKRYSMTLASIMALNQSISNPIINPY